MRPRISRRRGNSSRTRGKYTRKLMMIVNYGEYWTLMNFLSHNRLSLESIKKQFAKCRVASTCRKLSWLSALAWAWAAESFIDSLDVVRLNFARGSFFRDFICMQRDNAAMRMTCCCTNLQQDHLPNGIQCMHTWGKFSPRTTVHFPPASDSNRAKLGRGHKLTKYLY